jgi:hypothetical protein
LNARPTQLRSAFGSRIMRSGSITFLTARAAVPHRIERRGAGKRERGGPIGLGQRQHGVDRP